jgi:hypothetical protein
MLAVTVHPDDGVDTFLRNVGSYKSRTASDVGRWHSSYSPPRKPQMLQHETVVLLQQPVVMRAACTGSGGEGQLRDIGTGLYSTIMWALSSPACEVNNTTWPPKISFSRDITPWSLFVGTCDLRLQNRIWNSERRKNRIVTVAYFKMLPCLAYTSAKIWTGYSLVTRCLRFVGPPAVVSHNRILQSYSEYSYKHLTPINVSEYCLHFS